MAKIPLIGSSYTSRSLAASAQSCVNLIVEPIEVSTAPGAGVGNVLQGKNQSVLYGAPGRSVFALLAGSKGLWAGGGRLFSSDGLTLTEVAQAGTSLSSSTYAASTDGQPVTMFGNGNQLLVVSGGFAYIDNGTGPKLCRFQISGGPDTGDAVETAGTAVTSQLGSTTPFPPEIAGQIIFIHGIPYLVATWNDAASITLTTSAGVQVDSPWSSAAGDPVTAVMGAFLDGFFIVQRPEVVDGLPARQINISALNDGTNWDPLDFALKESYADHIRAILADHEQLYLFGTEKSECWQNTGDIFPFTRIAGAAAHFGAISSWAQASVGGNVYFLGGDASGGTVAYVINGFTPVRISTHAIEQQWAKQGGIFNAIAYSYLEEGHYNWVINGGAGQTFCYDITTSTWTRRARWDGAAYLPYDTRYHVFLPEWGGVHVTSGDATGGKLYVSSINLYSDDGSDIHWERALPYQYEAGHQLYFSRMDLDLETGTTTSVTVEPTIELDWSDDRGQTFSPPLSVGIGLHGDFTKRVYWNQLGGSRGRVFRFSGTGQSKVAIIDADLATHAGTH